MGRCTLDTDVVIAALDRRDAHHRDAAAAFKRFAINEEEVLLCTINYGEALVRPAENEQNLRAAVNAISSLSIRLLAPDAALARNAARRRTLGVSLADGFAIATAERAESDLASFDKGVQRALKRTGVRLSPTLAR